MSKAGIQSNRGDGYQTLVALDWALTVLSHSRYEWIEVDAVTWSVDDVVIGRTDGSIICCQCKKNQPGFNAWSIADLSDELQKAIRLLSNKANSVVRFYSRSPFGALQALKEYSTNYADESSYRNNLGEATHNTDIQLQSQLAHLRSSLSSYEFVRRVEFEISPSLERMEELLHERLRQQASNPVAAYDALWRRIDQLGARMASSSYAKAATQHRLTKDDLKAIIHEAGAMLTPSMKLTEIRETFRSTSSIGRTWRRDIAAHRISRPVVPELMAAIEDKHRSILLIGSPGSGKTCAMLELQEELEALAQTRSNLLPLFIQSREFADRVSAQDRQAHGLPEDWVEKVARMADEAWVIVVIDSLDVLSIAREHSVLSYFLAQLDRLLLVPNVTVVTACREFDRQYDRRIADRRWDAEFTCKPLNWDAEAAPLLAKLGVNTSTIDALTRQLICNPRELALFVELALRDGSFNVVTSQALAQKYLQIIIQANSMLGDAAMQAIEGIAAEMLSLRSLAVPRQRFAGTPEVKRALLSHNVLHETQDDKLAFGHQTLLDVLVISGALRRGQTLNEFIQGLPPVPFVRPSIRRFVEQLATVDRREMRKQLRTVLTGNAAFHIRRLVAEYIAGQFPHEDNWPLIRDLYNHNRDVFQVIYIEASGIEWNDFWFRCLASSQATDL